MHCERVKKLDDLRRNWREIYAKIIRFVPQEEAERERERSRVKRRKRGKEKRERMIIATGSKHVDQLNLTT